MDDEDDSFVTIGTPFEVPDEEESRKKPLSVQEQIAVDSKGRRRFHGAFTGGFSAGYFNSVGSKEGWTPSSFVSSREHRAESTNTKPEDFMDDEDMSEFGIAPKRVMAKQDFTPVEQETDSRKRKLEQDVRDGVLHTAIPGGVPVEDLIIPARLSIGVRLLRKMGWKEGQGVGTKEKKKIVVAKGDYMSMTDTTKDRKVGLGDVYLQALSS